MEDIEEISLDELRAHPEMILDALSQTHVSVVLKRDDSENIRVFKKKYSPEFINVMKQVDQEVERRKSEGYSKEDAKKDFLKVQDKIGSHINAMP